MKTPQNGYFTNFSRIYKAFGVKKLADVTPQGQFFY